MRKKLLRHKGARAQAEKEPWPLGQFNSVFNLRASRPKKSLGQHFLLHARIAERIVRAAHLSENSTVLEIGPGRGILTKALLARAEKVIAVEKDPALVEGLGEAFSAEIAQGRLTLVCADIRSWIRDNLNSRYSVKEGYHAVANIPYYLTGEIIRTLLEAKQQPRSMTLLVQKEVAERIARSQKESILSLSVKAYGIPKYEFTVPRGAFLPVPNVDSAVLAIRDISRQSFKSRRQEERFFALLHAGFAHKRKFASGNLARARFLTTGIPPKARAEDLPLATWLALSKG